ncbi:MAG: hypothetical protein AB1576_07440 [Bacillota bacterium]
MNPRCAVLSGGGLGSHSIEGIIIQASSEEALEVARSLARLQGMSCGISAGCNVAAASWPQGTLRGLGP